MIKKRITLLDFLTALNIPNRTFPLRKDCMIKQQTNFHTFFKNNSRKMTVRLEPVAFCFTACVESFTEQLHFSNFPSQ